MRLASIVLVAALLASGCQTWRQAAVTAGVSAVVTAGTGYVLYDARNDDEGPPIIFPVGFLVAGSLTVISGIGIVVLGLDSSTPPPPPTTTPPAS